MFSTAALDTLAPYIFAEDDRTPSLGAASDEASEVSDASFQAYDEHVVRLRAGDPSAFAELVQTHYNALVRFAASLLAASHDAEDVVQDVLIRVWDGRARLDPRRTLSTYLFTSVRNSALNRRRDAQTYERYVAATTNAAAEAITSPTPADELEIQSADVDEAARLAALAKAIAQLPERRRTALVLRFERNMTHAEIGAVLGISEKAAQQVVLRTIAELRGLLRT